VDAISNEMANIEFKLYKAGRGDVTEIEVHPILDLLSRANMHTTKYDLFYMSQTYLELAGESPWMLRRETKNGPPTEIYLLRPDLLTVKGSDDPTKGVIGGYTYKVYEESGAYHEEQLDVEDVLFLKYPDPIKPFRGRGTLQAVLRAFQMDTTAEEFNLMFFQNGASPSALLTVPKPLAKDSREKLEKMVKQKYTKTYNAHKTMIVEGEMKYTPLAMSQREMDYVQTMEKTRDKILAIFRVPRTVLGITDDVNRANAEATDLVFAKRTIKPKMEKLTEMLNEFLVPMFDNTGTLFLDYADPVPENVEQKLTLAKEGANAGILTPNEAREILGFDPIEGGDELKQPVAPFGGFGVTPPPDEQVPPEEGKRLIAKRKDKKINVNVERIRSSRKRNEKKRKAKQVEKITEGALTNAFAKIVEAQIRQGMKSRKEKKNPLFVGNQKEVSDQKYEFQNKQLKVADEHELRTVRAMSHIFKSQKEMILKRIEETGSIDADRIRLPEIKEAKRTHQQLEPIMHSVIKEQSREAFMLLGKAFDEFREKRFIDDRVGAVALYLRKRVFEMAKLITKESNEKLGAVLSQAVSDGLSIPKASKLVGEMFDNFGYRSERIARTEIIRASNFATEEAFKESGVVEGKEWLATIDERTGELDAALDGAVAKLGNDFKAGGESVPYPPLHPNCRCTLIPVIIA
jgi:HK97 family phage portal protein